MIRRDILRCLTIDLLYRELGNEELLNTRASEFHALNLRTAQDVKIQAFSGEDVEE